MNLQKTAYKKIDYQKSYQRLLSIKKLNSPFTGILLAGYNCVTYKAKQYILGKM